MSAFTSLETDQINLLLARYQRHCLRFSPASEGIENSNYFITASGPDGQQELVLTILESLSLQEVPWFVSLLETLHGQALPVPLPLASGEQRIQQLGNKPVLLQPRLPGSHPLRPTRAQCRAVGQTLAQLHHCGFSLPGPVADERSRLRQLAEGIPLLPADDQPPARQCLALWQQQQGSRCLIHGDLFRDNTLFSGDRLTGLLDFYHACYDLPVYDLAVTLNDWALDEDARVVDGAEAALLEGYTRVAPLAEPGLLPMALCVAALRFWLSRLLAEQTARQATSGRGSKPPAEFASKFRLRWQQWQRRVDTVKD